MTNSWNTDRGLSISFRWIAGIAFVAVGERVASYGDGIVREFEFLTAPRLRCCPIAARAGTRRRCRASRENI
jgi:hypothetical protein